MSGSAITMTDHTAEVIAAMRKGIGAAVRGTAIEIIKEYGATAPRDTGFMASSGYVVTHDETTYGQGVHGSGPMLPQIPKAENDTTAYAAIAADYAAYLEYGTSRMRAHPAFYPAFDKARPHFEKLLEKLEDAVRAAGVK